jgi:type II secretory pathway pseudopilin PulG
MMEVAISLAIIGIALVAIIGVLPIGMNVQQANRQETIIGQDASVLMEDIRNGVLGADELTNYVYYITNSWTEFDPTKTGPAGVMQQGGNGYTATSASTTPPGIYPFANTSLIGWLTNGVNIIGLLSTPEYTDPSGNPTANIYTQDYFSNHVVAYVYSISGPAYEKPPQDNTLMQQGSFGYRIYCVNTFEAVSTNIYDATIYTNGPPNYNEQMLNATHELRLTFLWPQQANGNLGSGRHTFRTVVAGRLVRQPAAFLGSPVVYNPNLYVYQPQSFANSP